MTATARMGFFTANGNARELTSCGLVVANKNIAQAQGTDLYSCLGGTGSNHANVIPLNVSGCRSLFPVFLAVSNEATGIATALNATVADLNICVYGRQVNLPNSSNQAGGAATQRWWPQDVLAADGLSTYNDLSSLGLWTLIHQYSIVAGTAIIDTATRSGVVGGVQHKVSGGAYSTLVQLYDPSGMAGAGLRDKSDYLLGCDQVVALVEQASTLTLTGTGTPSLVRAMLGFIPVK